jgi:type I restriction enzyme S subunit
MAARLSPLPVGEGLGEGGVDLIDALFPDSFQDSPLGKIPQGWAVATLDAFAVLNPEMWTKETAPHQIRYVDLSNVKWGRIESTTEYAWREAPSRAQRILHSGDTIVGTVRPANGSYALISEEGLTGSTGFAVLRPRKREFREVVYLGATAPDNIERLSHLADGAAYPAVRPDVVASTQFVRSPDAVLNCFSSAVRALVDKVAANGRESRTLAAIRDSLLPKLISGEIRARDTERLVGVKF